jgi:hypothetical protein
VDDEMKAINGLTHCPHCHRQLWDERLEENGCPKLDSVWEQPANEDGPGFRLRVTEVDPQNRYGRDVRGYICYKTKASGTEYDVLGEQFYSTSLDVFHKVWVRDPTAPRDNSLFTNSVS